MKLYPILMIAGASAAVLGVALFSIALALIVGGAAAFVLGSIGLTMQRADRRIAR